MAILNAIKEKLFGKSAPEPAPAPAPASTSTVSKPTVGSSSYTPGMSGGSSYTPGAGSPASKSVTTPQPAVNTAKPQASSVDIEAFLDAAVEKKGQKLNWRQSIVDLLKTIDLDSSLAARKELAADLNYTGPHADGTAEKNIWLHKEVMKMLAANGGKVPASLLK